MLYVIIGALPESLLNFRGELIKALISKHHQVIAMAAETGSKIADAVVMLGATFESYPVQRNGLNPAVDMKTLLALRKRFRELKPDVVMAYTIKPIIFGGLACRFLPNTRFYAMVEGLGFAFQGGSFIRNVLRSIVIALYRLALKRAESVIFLNPDNLNDFILHNIIPMNKAKIVNGTGVDLQHYAYTPLPITETTFLVIGRLLGDKGIREYAQAAQIVKARYPDTIFQLLGPEDPSPDGIPMADVQHWHQQGLLQYLGSTDDVRLYLQNCHVYVLPSYHEGMPRTVLEAMSIGRPILTTDVPGCRETVISGENGYLVPKANAKVLADRMIWFIENRDQWQRMGDRSRELAEEKYDVHKVNAQLMEIMGL